MENLLQEYITKGLVSRKGNWYNIISGEEKIALGNTETKATAKLQALINEGKLNAPSSTKETSTEEQSPKIESKPALEKEVTKKEQSAFEAFLSKVQDISTIKSGRNQTIFINGVKSTLTDHPEIKNCPLVFRWRKKEHMVQDGDGHTVKGYVVVSKAIMKNASFKLTVSRDDTPANDFYTVGDSVLCCTDRKTFIRRKVEQQLKAIMTPKNIKDQRNEFAKQQAKNSNVEDSIKNYSNVNSSDNQIMPSNLESTDDYSKMIENAKKVASMSDASADGF